MMLTLSELKTRKALVVVITDCRDKLLNTGLDLFLELPHCRPFASLLSLFPAQLLINEIAVLKGINPDKPRNLAKCVTVL
jgi:glucosamine--fructose-6-phosphate aminotransferase (isomerizing)